MSMIMLPYPISFGMISTTFEWCASHSWDNKSLCNQWTAWYHKFFLVITDKWHIFVSYVVLYLSINLDNCIKFHSLIQLWTISILPMFSCINIKSLQALAWGMNNREWQSGIHRSHVQQLIKHHVGTKFEMSKITLVKMWVNNAQIPVGL